MGHLAAMSQLVNRMRKDPQSLKILKRYEETFNSKDCPRLPRLDSADQEIRNERMDGILNAEMGSVETRG
jgi:hypothetical protein